MLQNKIYNIFYIVFMFIIIQVFLTTNIYSQHVLEIHYDGCNTKEFSLESDTTIAKISNIDFISAFFKSIDESAKDSIYGVITFQIIVYVDGSSCLLSVRNETNVPTDLLINKERLESNLIWEKPKKNISAIIKITITEDDMKYQRFGSNGKKGWHELIDK